MKKNTLLILFFLTSNLFSQNIDIQGHRGSRGTRPENTISAFKEALNSGVNTIELDVNITKDNVLVISHDRYINTEICLDPNGEKVNKQIPIISLSLDELKEYDCGTLKNPKFLKQKNQKESIPTLEELFLFVKNSTNTNKNSINFNIETKIVPGEPNISLNPKEFVEKLNEIIKKYNLEDRVIIQSFDYRTLKEMRKINPKIKLAQLLEGNLIDPEVISKLDVEIISPNFKWIDKNFIEVMHKNNKKVIPWTINDSKYWQIAIDNKVDGIITDYPEELITFMNKKKS